VRECTGVVLSLHQTESIFELGGFICERFRKGYIGWFDGTKFLSVC